MRTPNETECKSQLRTNGTNTAWDVLLCCHALSHGTSVRQAWPKPWPQNRRRGGGTEGPVGGGVEERGMVGNITPGGEGGYWTPGVL